MKIKKTRTLVKIEAEIIKLKNFLDIAELKPDSLIKKTYIVNPDLSDQDLVNRPGEIPEEITEKKISLMKKIAKLEIEKLAFGIPNQSLLNVFPRDKRLKPILRMAKSLISGKPISNFDLSRCIKRTLSNSDYKANHKTWNRKIQDKLRTLKNYWKGQQFKILSINTPIEGYQLIHK